MAVNAVSSSTNYSSANIQNQKSIQLKNEQTQVAKSGTEQAAAATNAAGTKTVSANDENTLVETSSYGDTVEISEQGMAKAQSLTTASGTAETDQSAETGTKPAGAKPAGGSKPSGAKPSGTAEEEETESTSGLSQYSEYELYQLLSKGTISKAEYDAELKSRKTETETTESAVSEVGETAVEQ